MYKQKDIDKMKKKYHDAVIYPLTLGETIEDEKYNELFEEFKTWIYKKNAFLEQKYGKEMIKDNFFGTFATSEFKTYFRSGFRLNYTFLDNLIESAKPEPSLSYFDQPFARKLFPIRQSVTVAAVTANAIWCAKNEIKDRSELKSTITEINTYAANSFKLLAHGVSANLDFFSQIAEKIEKDAKGKSGKINSFVKIMRSLEYNINDEIHKELNAGLIVTPV